MSQRTVAVVDYGMGNLRSVAQALRARRARDARATIGRHVGPRRRTPPIASSLPGQGAMPRLHARAPRRPALEAVVRDAAAGKPLLGVCIGLQMLLDRSEEGDAPAASGSCAGEVVRFRSTAGCRTTAAASRCRTWAGTRLSRRARIRSGRHPDDRSYFYFVHSYYARAGRRRRTALGETAYGASPLPRALARDNIFATQFHPEKSAAAGLALYRNFLPLESLTTSPGAAQIAGLFAPRSSTPLASAMLLIPAIDLRTGTACACARAT